MKATGEGKAFCPCIDEHLNMLFVPKLKFNLLSVRALVNISYVVTFRGDNCIIEKEGKRVTATLENDLYVICNDKLQKANSVYNNVKPHDECIHLLHRCLGHINFKMLTQTVKLSEGVKLKPCSKYLNCNVCNQEKSKIIPAN
uniref:GAG-pre-integrase domain-containing protein n=1 Tax=Micrurus surinamensis TaxID=129470 RepID=A0A2D4PVM3_MICSU